MYFVPLNQILAWWIPLEQNACWWKLATLRFVDVDLHTLDPAKRRRALASLRQQRRPSWSANPRLMVRGPPLERASEEKHGNLQCLTLPCCQQRTTLDFCHYTTSHCSSLWLPAESDTETGRPPSPEKDSKMVTALHYMRIGYRGGEERERETMT